MRPLLSGPHGPDHRLLDRVADLDLTYPEVGASLATQHLPGGYDHLVVDRIVGQGREEFDLAARALQSWQVHRGAGLLVLATSPTATLGTVVVNTLVVGPVSLPAPCRVVRTVADGDRVGFAYGTLPGHPERGEEAFVVGLEPGGEVRFTVSAFSRPALPAPLAGVVSRLGRPVQRRIALRYLDALTRGRPRDTLKRAGGTVAVGGPASPPGVVRA